MYLSAILYDTGLTANFLHISSTAFNVLLDCIVTLNELNKAAKKLKAKYFQV